MYKQAEIISGLKVAFDSCSLAVEEFPIESWDYRPEGKWSIGQNLDHLIKSTELLNTGLVLPKMILRARFGKPNDRPVRTYDQMETFYFDKLPTASKEMLSKSPSKADESIPDREQSLERWRAATNKCVKATSDKWPEKELDRCLLPHPLLGRLYVREMLFFMVYHTDHHVRTMKERNDHFALKNN